MPIRLLLFSSGVITVSFFPLLPPYWLLWGLLLVSGFLIRYSRQYWVVALLLGVAWGCYSGYQLQAMQLQEHWVGKELQVIGRVTDLPQVNGQRLRFSVKVQRVMHQGDTVDIERFPRKIQLSWYPSHTRKNVGPLPGLTTGQTWQLNVRLKRPRGFVNPAGFDYQAWLLRQGIGATGYVVGTKDNTLLEIYPTTTYWQEWIDRQRQLLQQWILSRSHSTERGILTALLIGDSAYVEKEQWSRMQQTGTSHLIAISGIHVGFLALFGFYLGLFLGKFLQLIWRVFPALVFAWLMAILCAAFYSALAGFNIPTLRTLIMLGLFYLACLGQRSIGIGNIFCCALVLVVIVDPLAAYDMGFWLSFGAVALLLFYFSGRWVAKVETSYWRGFSWLNLLAAFVRSQWVMFIGLLIPLSLLVNSISIVAPLANAIAIPVITFFVVPLLLIAAALQAAMPVASDFLLQLAGMAMELLKIFLQGILAVFGDYASPIVAFSPCVSLLLALGCLALLLPKGILHPLLGWCGLIPGLWLAFIAPAGNLPELKISVMDVGQGTAAVVQVKDKTLVYDTGPKYTDSFDAGGAILAPYLYSHAISRIDTLVVSHNDMDHIGGLTGFLEKVSPGLILVGDPEKMQVPVELFTASPTVTNCHQYAPWQWHNVEFAFLPVSVTRSTKDNNRSCVLLIRFKDQSILLPGDIEARVENQLLSEQKIPANLTLLLAAHHGSRTSSTEKFIKHTKPQFVIYSAGYRSQHGHPHPLVRKRFQSVGGREFNTAISGALIFEWFENKSPNIIEYRNANKRYWFE